MDYVFSLPLDDFNLSKFTPFPGSPLYETIREHGEFDEDWEKMDCMHFQFVPQGMTRERLERAASALLPAALHAPAGPGRLPGDALALAGLLAALRRGLRSFLAFARSERRFGKE